MSLTRVRAHRAAGVLAALALVAGAQGCSGEERASAPTVVAPATTPRAEVRSTSSRETTSPVTETGPERTTTTGQEPPVAPPVTTPRSQIAPGSAAGPLRFTSVRVFAGAAQRFAGRANATNRTAAYLNGARVSWSIVDRRGRRLDGGRTTLPSLAPGETTTIGLTGSRRFERSWAAVRFVVR